MNSDISSNTYYKQQILDLKQYAFRLKNYIEYLNIELFFSKSETREGLWKNKQIILWLLQLTSCMKEITCSLPQYNQKIKEVYRYS